MIEKFAQNLIFSQTSLSSQLSLSSQPDSENLPLWLQNIRSKAVERLNFLKFPTTADEEWRNTDFSELNRLFNESQVSGQKNFSTESSTPDFALQARILEQILPEAQESVIVFVDGKFAPEFSALTKIPKGVFCGSIKDFNHPETKLAANLDAHLGKYADANDFFVALNTACINDVAVIYVPKNLASLKQEQSNELTLQLVFASSVASISQPRCLVIIEAESELNLVETYFGLAQIESDKIEQNIKETPAYFCNSVTEVYLGANARLNHTKIQTESRLAVAISSCTIAQHQSSSYSNNSIILGAKKSRANLQVQQLGQATETCLNGLTLTSGDQFADTHSVIAHNFAHGSSQQLHKCIAAERSHCIFNGKILVAPAAQLTNSKQLSRNLLLAPKARIDTKPQLEIFADNVKCAHGATISQISEDELFYLQSRGIDFESAKKFLAFAFAAEVINQIPIMSLRESLTKLVKTN